MLNNSLSHVPHHIQIRFWERVAKDPITACWTYIPGTRQFRVGKQSYSPVTVALFLTGHSPRTRLSRKICGAPTCCNPDHLMPDTWQARFADRADYNLKTGCFEWKGACDRDGYGVFSSDPDFGRKKLKAHRLAYELHVGPIPDGLLVLHSCDNPPCVNPEHLFLGSADDNRTDMYQKRRHRHSESAVKLAPEDVIEIRVRSAAGETHVSLATEFGITRTHVGRLVNRHHWKDV